MIIDSIISALIGLAVEGTISGAKEKLKVILKKKGVDIPPPNTFEGAYIFSLIEFSEGKPSAAIELFKHEFIQAKFNDAYEQDNINILIAEIENLIDWHRVGEDFKDLDIDPKIFLEEFASTFNSIVDRTRSVYQIREERKLDTLLETTTKLEQQFSELSANLKYSVETSFDEGDAHEQIYKDRIAQANKLVKHGQAKTGKEMLKELERELKEKTVSQNLQYELLTNIASAHLHLEEYDVASNYLETALSLNKNEPKALANASLAALLRGDNKRAIDLSKNALAMDENQSNAISVLLQASMRENIEIDPDIKQRALMHIDSRRAFAILSFEKKDFETAESLYRENLSAPDPEVQDSVLLAQTIIATVEEKIPEGTHMVLLPPEFQNRLHEAEQLLINTKKEWEKDENRNRYVNTLGLLIQVQSLERKNDLVWSNCQRILIDFPDHYPALFHCGLIEFSRSNYKEAIRYFEKALTNQDSPDLRDRRIPLATAYLLDKRFDKVISLLQEGAPLASQGEDVERLVLLTKAYLGLNDKENANNTATLLDSFSKDDPYVLEGLAQVQIDLGKFEQARTNLESAYKLAKENEKSYFAIVLAEFYYQRGDFEEAIPLYESSFTPNKDIPVINHYLISLLNSGFYDKANFLAKQFRSEGASHPVFVIIEARIAEYIGELDYAKSLYLQLNDIDPENPDHLMRAAGIDYRNGNNEDAFYLLNQNIDKYWNDPLSLMTIAQIGASTKKYTSKILEYAYRARRLGMNDPNIHIAYVGLFLSIEDSFNKSLNLEKVGSDAAICVKTNGENKWYTILNDEPADKGRGEILASDPLAQKMMGLRKGDIVQIREDFYDKLEFTVTEIQSKYVRAFQETLMEFGYLFPENLGIQMIKTEPGDPTKMFALSARQNQMVRKVSEFYTRENLTVGQFAKLIGSSQIKTWAGLFFNEGIVKVSTGTSNEQEVNKLNISQAEDITLELTSLLTLTYVDQLGLLAKRFENIYIAHSVIDAVIEEIYSEERMVRDYLTIEQNVDRSVVQEIKEEQIRQRIEWLNSIKEFIQENCKIVPVEFALKLEKGKYEELINIFSTSSIDSVLVAKQTNTLLYSDDMLLRGIAKNDFAVDGIWTQPVLQNCWERGIIAELAYHETIAKLIHANCIYVPIEIKTLLHFLEKNNWVPGNDASRVFQVLAGPYTTIGSAIRIGVELVKEVWAKKILIHQKNNILSLLLSVLVKNRLSIPAIRLFTDAIQGTYSNSFTPWYADQIISHSRLWLQTYLSTSKQSILQ